MGRIIGIGLIGWAAIVALAWNLADKRIAICQQADTYTATANCTIRAMSVRDSILTGGLVVGLGIILIGLAVGVAPRFRRSARPTSWKPTSSGQPARLR